MFWLVFLVLVFFLENLLCSNIPIVHGFRGLNSCDNPVFPEINGNFIVDLGANRLPFILRHSIKLDPPLKKNLCNNRNTIIF